MADQPGGARHAAILVGWFVAVSIPLVPLSLQHLVPLGRATATRPARAAGVGVRHVLSVDCNCSRAVAASLIARTARTDEIEEVWLVGKDEPFAAALRRAGYLLRETTAANVRRELGPAGAPFLIVYAADARELYAGGYAPRRPRQAADVRDASIVSSVRSGVDLAPYPTYGCLGREDVDGSTSSF